MSKYCNDCGEKVFSGKCTNCDEETFIIEQYYEQGMELPDEDSEFMQNYREQQAQPLK